MTDEDRERIGILELLRARAELEKFRDFAQPHVIRASELWDKIHAREGLRDHFGPIRRGPLRLPLEELDEALDTIRPIEPNQEIGESKPTQEGAD